MKIPFTDINLNFSRIDNAADQKLPKKADARRIPQNPVQVYRITTDLAKFRNAVIAAENIQSPQRFQLYQIYQQTVLDAHLSAAIQQRKNLILGKSFVVLNPDGKENEEKTELIRKKWFRDFVDLSLDSRFYGHSLIQFDSLEMDEFKCVDLVPRIYVKPELHIVTDTYAAIEGRDYLDYPFKGWCIGVGQSHDLGLLLKASPLVIWKKGALGAWAEHIEKFGTPIRIGKTDVRDEQTRVNMENFMKNMNVAPWAVLDKDDLIEFAQTSGQDVHQIYDMMINRCNSEISKLILGQTATMDEKSFVGSAEVHERVLKDVCAQDQYFIEGVLNYQLIPLLNERGLGFEGLKIEFEPEEEMNLVEQAKIDLEFIKTGKYKMSTEDILEKYGTEFEEVKEEKPEDKGFQRMKNSLKEYYGE